MSGHQITCCSSLAIADHKRCPACQLLALLASKPWCICFCLGDNGHTSESNWIAVDNFPLSPERFIGCQGRGAVIKDLFDLLLHEALPWKLAVFSQTGGIQWECSPTLFRNALSKALTSGAKIAQDNWIVQFSPTFLQGNVKRVMSPRPSNTYADNIIASFGHR